MAAILVAGGLVLAVVYGPHVAPVAHLDPTTAVQPPPAAAVGMSAKGAAPTAAAPAAAPVWTVDKAASRLTFRASLGGQPVDGVFKTWDAEIAFDPKDLKASHAVVVVDTASAVTGEPTRDELLPTANWLSTRRYPRATLTTRSVTETAPGRYEATADLKLKNLSRRVVIPFTLTFNHDVGRMQATLTLDRNAYGVGDVPGMPLSALAPDVVVNLRLVARKSH